MVIGKILRFTLTQISKRRLPIIDGKLKVPGLKDESVEIIRDKWGIPHIYAENNYDLFFAQGFVQAQDRLWQMEQNRRLAKGTLSEILGELTLETDIATRTFGFARLGKIDWDHAGKEVKEVIQAFTDGVNAFLEHPKSKLPVEFTLLRYKPEKWEPTDTTAFARIMLWKLSHAWYGELVRAKIIEKVGAEKASELEIRYPMENPVTLPKGIDFNILGKDGTLTATRGPFLAQSQGSNSWVVSKKNSKDGATYLCNDMHLELMMPSIWYETHLISSDFNVSGVSLSGVPLILVGHNDRIAWGSTLAFTDAEDLYIEKFNPEDSSQYEFKNEWKSADIIEEKIIVKKVETPHIEKVVVTQHGPIISGVMKGTTNRIAVNSMALRPSQALKGYLSLNKAKNWNEFMDSVRLIDATQLNMTYADVEDNIGYWVTGKVPIRAEGHVGNVPVPGWTGDYEWQGDIPFDSMPYALNPQEGYLITCNHKIIPDDFPYFLGDVWMNGYRAKRFIEFFEEKGRNLSLNDFKELMLDVTCIPGKEFKSFIQGINLDLRKHAKAKQALTLLGKWNGVLSSDSVGGTIYQVLRYNIVLEILKKGLGKELTFEIMGNGFHPVLYHTSEFYGHDTTIMMRLLRSPDSWWISQVGGVHEILIRNLVKTISWLEKEYGKDEKNWKWGALHRVHFPHAMGLKKPLDQVFDRGNLPIGGDTDTLCQTAIHPETPYDVNAWAPSHRQIINLNDLSKSLMIFAPGQSGHLASKHYDDLIQLWYNGEYHPMLWEKKDIIENAEGHLILFTN